MRMLLGLYRLLHQIEMLEHPRLVELLLPKRQLHQLTSEVPHLQAR